MKNLMPPRFQTGADFFDKALMDCYQSLGYPEKWIKEGQSYSPEESYVISHPSWFMEAIPIVPMVSIYQLFRNTAQSNPNETAVIFLDKKISYQDLDDLICRYATMLKGLGIGKGDVVATMLP